jgi:hypothetical protein
VGANQCLVMSVRGAKEGHALRPGSSFIETKHTSMDSYYATLISLSIDDDDYR